MAVQDDVGDQQDPAACAPQPQIELNVLIPDQFFVESSDAVEHLPAIAAEGDGVDPARFAHADAVIGVADAERMADRHRNRPGDHALVGGAHPHDAADVVGAALLQVPHQARD